MTWFTSPNGDAAADDRLVSDLYRRAVRGDTAVAVRLISDLLDRGVPAEVVIGEMLATVLRQVGDGWYRGTVSAAGQHRAAGVVQRSLEAIAASQTSKPAGAVVHVACAVGEWHAVPAQMLAGMLRTRGLRVDFLGASPPPEYVADAAGGEHGGPVVISCTMVSNLPGVADLVGAVHAHDRPVLVGGAAFDTDNGRQWASRLGADAWAASVDDAVGILETWQQATPPIRRDGAPWSPGLRRLYTDAGLVADTAVVGVPAIDPAVSLHSKTWNTELRDGLTAIARCAVAARLVDDPLALTGAVDWLAGFLANRDLPEAVVKAGLRALVVAMAPVDQLSADLVADAL